MKTQIITLNQESSTQQPIDFKLSISKKSIIAALTLVAGWLIFINGLTFWALAIAATWGLIKAVNFIKEIANKDFNFSGQDEISVEIQNEMW
jgi:hypothetical protein